MTDERSKFIPSPLYILLKNWSVYTGLSFLSCLAVVVPFSRIGVAIALTGYLLFGIANLFMVSGKIELNGQFRGMESVLIALKASSIDFILFFLAIIAGLYIGGFTLSEQAIRIIIGVPSAVILLFILNKIGMLKWLKMQ